MAKSIIYFSSFFILSALLLWPAIAADDAVSPKAAGTCPNVTTCECVKANNCSLVLFVNITLGCYPNEDVQNMTGVVASFANSTITCGSTLTCLAMKNCTDCLHTTVLDEGKNNVTCEWDRKMNTCSYNYVHADSFLDVVTNPDDCNATITTTTTVPETTTIATTTPKATTTSTTPATTSSSTTTSTTKAPETTTVTPNVTTPIPPTSTPPSERRFDGPSFIGGIVLALGCMAISFVAWKFYKARTERNYHTL